MPQKRSAKNLSFIRCTLCNARLTGRGLNGIEKRWNHFVRKHPDAVLRLGVRVAENPVGFGRALGEFVRVQLQNYTCRGLR